MVGWFGLVSMPFCLKKKTIINCFFYDFYLNFVFFLHLMMAIMGELQVYFLTTLLGEVLFFDRRHICLHYTDLSILVLEER